MVKHVTNDNELIVDGNKDLDMLLDMQISQPVRQRKINFGFPDPFIWQNILNAAFPQSSDQSKIALILSEEEVFEKPHRKAGNSRYHENHSPLDLPRFNE
jgi:hypothetical protein